MSFIWFILYSHPLYQRTNTSLAPHVQLLSLLKAVIALVGCCGAGPILSLVYSEVFFCNVIPRWSMYAIFTYIWIHLGHIWGKCSQIFHTWIIRDFNISNVTSIYLMLRIYTLYTLYTSDISYHILSRRDTYAYGSSPCVFEVSIDTLDLPSRFGSSWKTWLILPLVVRIHKQPRG